VGWLVGSFPGAATEQRIPQAFNVHIDTKKQPVEYFDIGFAQADVSHELGIDHTYELLRLVGAGKHERGLGLRDGVWGYEEMFNTQQA
jgi:hypothetical protein